MAHSEFFIAEKFLVNDILLCNLNDLCSNFVHIIMFQNRRPKCLSLLEIYQKNK